MREKFKAIPYDTVVLDKDGKEVPDFRISRLGSCHYNHYKDLTDSIDITDGLNSIFDEGNNIHYEEYCLNKGSKRIIDAEQDMKVVHINRKFTLSGHNDAWEHDYRGRFFRDYKTTKFEGFLYFLQDEISLDYIIQQSGYAYLKYIIHGVYCNDGVVTKIDREEPRNRISRAFKLMSLDKIRAYIYSHPVILCMIDRPPIDPDKPDPHEKYITVDQLIEACVIQMQGQEWKCTNCQYLSVCPVFMRITKK